MFSDAETNLSGQVPSLWCENISSAFPIISSSFASANSKIQFFVLNFFLDKDKSSFLNLLSSFPQLLILVLVWQNGLAGTHSFPLIAPLCLFPQILS